MLNLNTHLEFMRQIQFKNAIKEAMSEEMRKDNSIFLIGEEVAEYNGAYKVSEGMLKEFGSKRVVDTPISELGFAGLGIGASINGLRPIVEFMTFNFSLVAIDQVINNAAKMYMMSGGQFNVPIVFRGPTGSAGSLACQHSQNFESWYGNCPGLKVVVPSNPQDAKGLLKSAIQDNDPVIFMESEQMYGDIGEVPEEEYYLPIGKAVVKQKGKDVTVVSYGKIMKIVLQVSNELKKEGIDIEIIDLQSIRPLDIDTVIQSVKKTNRLVIVEEAWPLASVSSEISYQVQKHVFDYLDAPIQKINSLDIPMPFSKVLVPEVLPNTKKVIEAIKAVLYV